MFFRRAARRDSREDAWAGIAGRLDLQAADDGFELLDGFLDLADTPLNGPVYRTRHTGEVEVLAFDVLQPSVRGSNHHHLVTSCLLVASEPFSSVPLRITRQLRSQLAGIQAGATQAEVVTCGSDDGFDERVTVVARDSAAAAGLLTADVRMVIERTLDRCRVAPTLVVSERQLLLSARADAFELAELEYLIADVLALHVALAAADRA